MHTTTNVAESLTAIDPFGERVEMYGCSADMPLDCVRPVVVACETFPSATRRDEAERAFDRGIARCIAACKTPGDTF